MKRYTSTIGIIISPLFFTTIFFSCVSKIIPDFEDFSDNIVVNSLLNPDSLVNVKISESVSSLHKEQLDEVLNASASIMSNDSVVFLHHQGKGIYSALFYPIPGNKYNLSIVIPDRLHIRSQTFVPHQPQIELVPNKTENLIEVFITDNVNEKNTFWIGQKVRNKRSGSVYYETYIYSDFFLFDDFNRTSGGEIIEGISHSYHFYVRLDDYLFNGKKVSFIMPRKWPNDYNDIDYEIILFIINADEHLDQYMKSALIQYELGVIGDMPVFHTPIDMYTNIENGKGIFGSCTISQFDITTPESIYQKNVLPNEK